MHCGIPSEMVSGALQLAIYFIAAAGALLSFMLTSRA